MEPRTIAGRYELLERLDTGWRARDTELGREVVVLVGDEASSTPEQPSIGRIFDRGEADGEQFAVFEYLTEELEPATLIQPPPPAAGRRLPSPRMLAIGAGVALIAAAGIGSAFLATTGTSSNDKPTTSLSVPVPTASTGETTEQTAPPSTAETTTETTTTAETETEPTTAPTTTPPPATTAPPPPPTTAPPLPTEPPPPTTEPPPPPTTEPPPPTTTG